MESVSRTEPHVYVLQMPRGYRKMCFGYWYFELEIWVKQCDDVIIVDSR